jgi:hypothetical protein
MSSNVVDPAYAYAIEATGRIEARRCLSCGGWPVVGGDIWCARCLDEPEPPETRQGDYVSLCCHGKDCPHRCPRCGFHTKRTLRKGRTCGFCRWEKSHPGQSIFGPHFAAEEVLLAQCQSHVRWVLS